MKLNEIARAYRARVLGSQRRRRRKGRARYLDTFV
jgi:hypothetical protein